MKGDQIIAALKWRYATKKYDPTKKISEADWAVLKEALRLAPSSFGLQPWQFLVVQSPALRKVLRKVSWDQSIVEDCSHMIVLTTLREMTQQHIEKNIKQAIKDRGLDPGALDGRQQHIEQKILIEKPRETHLSWNQRQVYIALGFILETAALLRIDATPMEGLEPERYDEILGLQDTPYTSVVVVVLGYRDAQDSYQQVAKTRFPETEVIKVIS